MAVRILLIDDHRVVRTGLRALLEAVADFEVVGEADNGTHGLRLAQQAQRQSLGEPFRRSLGPEPGHCSQELLGRRDAHDRRRPRDLSGVRGEARKAGVNEVLANVQMKREATYR